MNEQIYTNYRLQLPNEEILGTLVVRDSAIADIQPGVVNQGENGEGEILMPSAIELHTDNLEKCMSPRPGIEWPLEAAATYHDRDLIAAGITTVCDAIAIGDIKPGSRRLMEFEPAIHIIEKGQKKQKFVADHRLHLRCELSYKSVCDVAEKYAGNSLLSLISLMDHTPGQRQFVSIEKYKEYYMGKHGISAAEMDTFIRSRQQNQQQYAQPNRQALVKMTQQRGIFLASHDDATVDHVQEAVRDGAAIAEFPTTIEAAQTACSQGLQVLLGAPNVVLGGSHSGNVAAIDLLTKDFGNILSSDYVPHSLLQLVFIVSEKTGKPLYETMRLATSNPAKAIGLFGDRGSLEIGKRADLICVRDDRNVPRLTSVVRSGKRVA